MSNYQIIIATERRTPVVTERRIYKGEYINTYELDEHGDECCVQIEADPANFEIVLDEDRSRLAQDINGQLHSFSAAGLPENLDDPQFVMVAEWDGVSPYVIQHKGDYAARTMGYAGWPDLTKEQYDALPTPSL